MDTNLVFQYLMDISLIQCWSSITSNCLVITPWLIKFDCSKLYFELSRGQKRHFEGYLSSFGSVLVLWKAYSLLTTFETSEKSQYWFVSYGTTLHGQQNDEAPLVTSMKCVNKLTFFKYSDSFFSFLWF